MTTPSPLESRLARVERALTALSAEVAAIRAELGLRATDAARDERSSPSPPATSYRVSRGRFTIDPRDLERLVGSYGMLGISVLAAVAAVGTFLSWAIGRGYLILGPPVRVAIGLLFATAIGAWGFRLRRRERSFGSSLMGLALVIVHVCAYAAGPTFALVPTWVAFLGSAVVSWGLAIFAHVENDEPLWCVAFGGAAVAPFVTSDGHGSVYALLAYGTLVLLAACFAISRRAWPVAWRVFYVASALFTIAGAWQVRRDDVPHFLVVFGFPFLIAVAGITPFAAPARKRGALRWLALLAVFTAFVRQSAGAETNTRPVAAAIFSASCICLFFADRHAGVPQSSLFARARGNPVLLDWIDAALIPLVLALHAAFAVDSIANTAGLYAASAATFVVFAWRRSVGSLRDAAAFAATMMGMAAVAAFELEEPTGIIGAFAVIGLAALAAHVLRPSRSWLFMGFVALVAAALRSANALVERPIYHDAPFLSEASGAALIVAVALVVPARWWPALRLATRTSIGPRPEWTYVAMLKRIMRGVISAPAVWVFVWCFIELATAYSATASTLLLVTYFAAVAVACVAAGRARRSSRLRQIGLALALLAAGTAVYGAHAYFDFGARIAAYLVTSAFLLGIAYWYRRPGGAGSAVMPQL